MGKALEACKRLDKGEILDLTEDVLYRVQEKRFFVTGHSNYYTGKQITKGVYTHKVQINHELLDLVLMCLDEERHHIDEDFLALTEVVELVGSVMINAGQELANYFLVTLESNEMRNYLPVDNSVAGKVYPAYLMASDKELWIETKYEIIKYFGELK